MGQVQEDACVHRTPIGSRCELCGGGVVGGDYPGEVAKGQIWRARGAPYGKVGVIEVEGIEVTFYELRGPTTWNENDFRDEFWFWGQPPHPDDVETTIKSIVAACVAPEDYAPAIDLIADLLERSTPSNVRPFVDLVKDKAGKQILVVDWGNEEALRAWFKRK